MLRNMELQATISVAVETSGRLGSVAVARGDTILAASSFNTRQNHGVELMPTVDRLCAQAKVTPHDIGLVFVSGGPGSFTGLRIGVTFAKALALATGVRVVRVPTLDIVAQNALHATPRPPKVTVMLDAKRKNVFAATFALEGDLYRPLDEPAERAPADYLTTQAPVAVLGEGVSFHESAIRSTPSVTILPDELNEARAEVVHRLGLRMAREGQFIPQNELIPIYVRRPEAEEKWEARQDQPQGR